LKRREPSAMKYGRIAGLDKPISRLVFGCATINTPPDAAIMLDAYFGHGGNAFDTSYGYGNPNGATERNLAAWIRARGVRDQVVVIEKGGNPPYVTPQGVEYEFTHGLERLEMDRVDLYVIHRDNEQVPIGEWVDLLNRHLRAGHMSAFGLSNFSIPRLEAFNAYAKQHNLATFSVVSNNFSLAQVKDVIWPGFHLVSSSVASSRAWFERTRTPLMPWSSQAQGFFARAAREKRDDPELVRCWYDDANFARFDRAQELARKHRVEPVNIALAYVLCQPFPTFPIIGPRRPAEVASCMRALKIELSLAELAWLAG
jgi:aryl-alcohol dehydrogenase-like predicted oxidoreductase